MSNNYNERMPFDPQYLCQAMRKRLALAEIVLKGTQAALREIIENADWNSVNERLAAIGIGLDFIKNDALDCVVKDIETVERIAAEEPCAVDIREAMRKAWTGEELNGGRPVTADAGHEAAMEAWDAQAGEETAAPLSSSAFNLPGV